MQKSETTTTKCGRPVEKLHYYYQTLTIGRELFEYMSHNNTRKPKNSVCTDLRNRLFKGLLLSQIYFQNFTAQKLRPRATTPHWGHKNKTATLIQER